MSLVMCVGVAVYRCLLHVYPQHFRHAFGEEMQQTLAERMAMVGHTGWIAVLRVLLHEYGGLVMGGIRERFTTWKESWTMKRVWGASVLLIMVGLVLIGNRMVASYFCNLANPSGGGALNRLACEVSLVHPGTSVYAIFGYVILLCAAILITRTLVVRRPRR